MTEHFFSLSLSLNSLFHANCSSFSCSCGHPPFLELIPRKNSCATSEDPLYDHQNVFLWLYVLSLKGWNLDPIPNKGNVVKHSIFSSRDNEALAVLTTWKHCVTISVIYTKKATSKANFRGHILNSMKVYYEKNIKSNQAFVKW